MGKRLYGSLQNRLEEDRMFCDEIQVGTGVTEYYYSDRRPYEVIEVRDQKHVTVRELDHVHEGDGCMDNRWKLISNPENAERTLEKRGDWWYWRSEIVITDENRHQLDDQLTRLRLAVAGWDIEKLMSKGKQIRRQRAKVSFGVAEYYYDYEF